MKKTQYLILAIIALLSSYTTFAQDIHWVSLEEAISLQKKKPKKILMDVYTVWCGPCKMLDKRTFKNPDLAAYVNENYYAVKFNGEGNSKVTYKEQTFVNKDYDEAKKNTRNSPHDFARYLQINAYPTIVFFDEDTNVITPLRGFFSAQQLELYLKLFKNDTHKSIKSQEEFDAYLQDFKPQFQG